MGDTLSFSMLIIAYKCGEIDLPGEGAYRNSLSIDEISWNKIENGFWQELDGLCQEWFIELDEKTQRAIIYVAYATGEIETIGNTVII